MRVAGLYIDAWGGKFVVVGEFGTFSQVPQREFSSYAEALVELAKIAQREALRYESGIDRRSNW